MPEEDSLLRCTPQALTRNLCHTDALVSASEGATTLQNKISHVHPDSPRFHVRLSQKDGNSMCIVSEFPYSESFSMWQKDPKGCREQL